MGVDWTRAVENEEEEDNLENSLEEDMSLEKVWDEVKKVREANSYSVSQPPSGPDWRSWIKEAGNSSERGINTVRTAYILKEGVGNGLGDNSKIDEYLEGVLETSPEKFREGFSRFVKSDSYRKLSVNSPMNTEFDEGFNLISALAIEQGDETEVFGEDYLKLNMSSDYQIEVEETGEEFEFTEKDITNMYQKGWIGKIRNETYQIFIDEETAQEYADESLLRETS